MIHFPLLSCSQSCQIPSISFHVLIREIHSSPAWSNQDLTHQLKIQQWPDFRTWCLKLHPATTGLDQRRLNPRPAPITPYPRPSHSTSDCAGCTRTIPSTPAWTTAMCISQMTKLNLRDSDQTHLHLLFELFCFCNWPF